MKTWMTIIVVGAMAGCGGASVEGGVTPPPPPTAGGSVTVQMGPGPGGLFTGGSTSNFGRFGVTPGFLPDPHDQAVVSGGDVDASTLGVGQGCIGWVTRQPDYIMDLSASSAFLRVYVTSEQGEDTTLVINDGSGQWHCNDDSYGGRNPSVDIANAPPGQYDIWVGSYQSGVRANGVLHITEIQGNHP
jgi:hypothetical protein